MRLAATASGAVPVLVAAAVSALVRDYVDLADIAMLFLVAIATAAAFLGRGASLVASALSVAAFNFFFVHPFYTFAVSDFRHIVTFVVMLFAGLVISSLTDRIRRQSAAAREREIALALERAQLADEAQRAQLRAETEEMRSSLLSSVSHDLRTPIGTVLGAATALLDAGDTLPREQRTELVATIRDEAARLARLVGNLLDMTRVEASGLEVKKEWVPLEELVGAVMNRFESRLGTRPVRIDVPPEVVAHIDPVLFEQVVVNLVENALRHTGAETPIEISAAAAADEVTLDVADRGPGLAPGSEARIFEKFVRGDGSSGVGLGLAICRGIVHAHGGMIVASNRPEGGAAFRVTLPLDGTPPTLPAEPELAGGTS